MSKEISYAIGTSLVIGFVLGLIVAAGQNIPQYEIDKAVRYCEDNGGVHTYKVAINKLQVCTCGNGKVFYGDSPK